MIRMHTATNTWTGTRIFISSIYDSDWFYLCHWIGLNGRHKVGIIDVGTDNLGRSIIFDHLAFLARWVTLRRMTKGLLVIFSVFFVVFIFIAIIRITSAIALFIFTFLILAFIRLPVSEELLLEVKYPWMLEYLDQWNSLIWVLL